MGTEPVNHFQLAQPLAWSSVWSVIILMAACQGGTMPERRGESIFWWEKEIHTSYSFTHILQMAQPKTKSSSSDLIVLNCANAASIGKNKSKPRKYEVSQVPRTSSKWVGEPDWRSPNQSSCALNINVAADWVMVTFVGMREKARGQVVGKPIPISQGKQRGPRRTIYMWVWSYIRIPFRGSPEIWPGLCLSLWRNFAFCIILHQTEVQWRGW